MNRRGFTLIEIMLAVVILGIVLLGTARFTAQFLHTVSISTVRTVAAEVAQERIELVSTDPSYTTLAARWAATETGFPGFPRMQRQTTVARTTGTTPPRDYTTVTVTVTEPTLYTPVKVTTTVGRP